MIDDRPLEDLNCRSVDEDPAKLLALESAGQGNAGAQRDAKDQPVALDENLAPIAAPQAAHQKRHEQRQAWNGEARSRPSVEPPLHDPPDETRAKPHRHDDVFSLAVVLHEMLTGCRPRRDFQKSRPIGVAEPLYDVLRGAMPTEAKNCRFASAGAFGAALRSLLGAR